MIRCRDGRELSRSRNSANRGSQAGEKWSGDGRRMWRSVSKSRISRRLIDVKSKCDCEKGPMKMSATSKCDFCRKWSKQQAAHLTETELGVVASSNPFWKKGAHFQSVRLPNPRFIRYPDPQLSFSYSLDSLHQAFSHSSCASYPDLSTRVHAF